MFHVEHRALSLVPRRPERTTYSWQRPLTGTTGSPDVPHRSPLDGEKLPAMPNPPFDQSRFPISAFHQGDQRAGREPSVPVRSADPPPSLASLQYPHHWPPCAGSFPASCLLMNPTIPRHATNAGKPPAPDPESSYRCPATAGFHHRAHQP